MEIKYYKKSCKLNCDWVNEESLTKILNELSVSTKPEIITGIEKAQADGVVELPALVVNGEVKLMGYVPSEKEMMKTIKKTK